MSEIQIKFGILNPPLHEQLVRQGLKCSKIDHFEKLRESVNYLKMSCLITDVAASKLYGKIFDQLFGLVERIEGK